MVNLFLFPPKRVWVQTHHQKNFMHVGWGERGAKGQKAFGHFENKILLLAFLFLKIIIFYAYTIYMKPTTNYMPNMKFDF
jgi:hypothetical protein